MLSFSSFDVTGKFLLLLLFKFNAGRRSNVDRGRKNAKSRRTPIFDFKFTICAFYFFEKLSHTMLLPFWLLMDFKLKIKFFYSLPADVFQLIFDRLDAWSGLITEIINLESEQQQEGHHKTEKSHSFRQGEAQDGVWEQLLFEWWISGVANDEWTEHCSDTGTCGFFGKRN